MTPTEYHNLSLHDREAWHTKVASALTQWPSHFDAATVLGLTHLELESLLEAMSRPLNHDSCHPDTCPAPDTCPDTYPGVGCVDYAPAAKLTTR